MHPQTATYANPVSADSPFGKREYLGAIAAHTQFGEAIIHKTSFAEVGIARQIRTWTLAGVNIAIGSDHLNAAGEPEGPLVKMLAFKLPVRCRPISAVS